MSDTNTSSSGQSLFNLKSCLIGVGMGTVVTALVFLLFYHQPIDKVSVKLSGGSVSLDVKSSEIKGDSILSKLFKDPFTRAGAINWLSQKDSLFLLNSQELEEAIEKSPHNAPVSRQIRDMFRNRIGPFRIVADIAYLAVPKYRIPDDTAYTWNTSSYAYRKVKLQDSASLGIGTDVYCVPKLGDPHDDQFNVDLHIGIGTARKLFGSLNLIQSKSPIRIYVTPINHGY